MSKEFEEIVLKKLDNLETEVVGLKTEVGSLNTEVVGLKTEVGSLKTRVGNLEIEVKETQEVVLDLRNNFAKFDYEINKKIDTLFDAYSINNEKHTSYEKDINSLNAKTFNHDIRISNLENNQLVLV